LRKLSYHSVISLHTASIYPWLSQ